MVRLSEEERKLLRKYQERIVKEFHEQMPAPESPIPQRSKPKLSVDYTTFKQENRPTNLSLYEKLCNISERIIKISPGKSSEEKIAKELELCHISSTPTGAFSFAVLSFMLTFVFFAVLGLVFLKSTLIVIFGLLCGLGVLLALIKMPEFLGNNWRLSASNQMVQCIFYIVTYMRHTSNLELAIKFASEHLPQPLSLDLKKVIWDVETEKYETIKDSLENYLDTWTNYNQEFIEAIHLVEGSLYESSEEKRISMVDKSLEVMLQETYEKMLRYSHELKAPITMLYMLGIILPVLGLVILPMIASFMTTDVAPLRIAFYIGLIYNIGLPLIIYYLSKMVLSKRPTGYGNVDITDIYPELKKLRNLRIKIPGIVDFYVNPIYLSLAIGGILLFIGLIPVILGAIIPDSVLVQEKPIFMGFKLLEYRYPQGGTSGELIGPYGLGSSLISLLIPLAAGLGFGLYYRIRSANVIKIRDNTKKLEDEFVSALFQLGNRLGDGIPAEVAFGKVADVTKGTQAGTFFSLVDFNMRNRGVDLEDAIFNPKYGAILSFPSNVIVSSMKVLVESSKKGPKIAAQAMINVSEYIKDIHRVDERLKDLMADIVSDMKQQVKILAPAIAGIVVGITSMIVSILGRLTDQISAISSSSGATGASVPAGLITLFGDGVPTYFFQAIVGLYIVQIVYIMTTMLNGVENGADKLAERYQLGQSLINTTLIYVAIAFFVIVMFTVIATSVLSGISPTTQAL
ncbi:MAG: hypothetical protein V1702_00280 [Candidatus Woesearchaeota archaeon]